MTTPGALRDAVFRVRGDAIARQASEQLAREQPDRSYHAGLSWPQTLAILVILLAVAFAGIAVGRPALLATVLLFGCPFLALAGIKIAAVLDPSPVEMRRFARSPDADLPIYTVLVPLHRERRVLPQLRRALVALDYPALCINCTN